MKYYDDEQMRDIRETLEADIMKWPGVVSKEMMGCLCYFRGKKFFAFLVTDAIVLTKLPKQERALLSRRAGSRPFEMAGRTASAWVQVPLKAPKELGPLMAYVRNSYDEARA